MSLAYVAIGSNIDPLRHVAHAVERFADEGELVHVSTFYRTRAIGGGPDFVNGVVALRPRDAAPRDILARLRDLEAASGRVRAADAFAPRTLDLDLVAWPGHAHPRLPHSDIERYAFVSRPLAEIAPHVVAASGRTVGDVARSTRSRGMRQLPSFTRTLRAHVPAPTSPSSHATA